jgi:bifunctional ADP-heptose synthase (sugar kinase/adenylyltransferase)
MLDETALQDLFKKAIKIGRISIDVSPSGEDIMYSANATWLTPGMGGISANVKASGASTVLSECLTSLITDYETKKALLVKAVTE